MDSFQSAEEDGPERAHFAPLEVVDLEALRNAITEPYKNISLLDINQHCLRLAAFEGDYRWHYHPDTDELFLVLAGELHIDLVDGTQRVLAPMQSVVIPAGAVHRTRAVGRTVNLTFEKQGAQTVFVEAPAISL